MGLFDFLKGSKTKAGPSDRPTAMDKTVARYAESISKKAQNLDRQAAIDDLVKQIEKARDRVARLARELAEARSKLEKADTAPKERKEAEEAIERLTRELEAAKREAAVGNPAAAAALMRRFTFVVDPSITDQEERDTAFRGIIAAGSEALPAIREFCVRAESLTWPLRMMRALLDEPAYVAEVLALLESWDTEYARNADPKIQLIAALEEIKDARIRPALERFLDDVHEPTRFHAATTLLAQDDPEVAGPLARALVREEANRTVNRIAEGLATRGWTIPEADRDALAGRLPRPFVLVDGRVTR
jgi:seryl-tRNA synthetase